MTKLRNFGILAAATILALTGCAGQREAGLASSIQLAEFDSLPQPSQVAGTRVGPLQPLDIVVSGASDLSGQFVTDENGALWFPLIGLVDVNGLTPNGVARVIANRLDGEYVKNPQVRVIAEDTAAMTISVGGEVESPGTYQSATTYSLLRAVNEAGGLSDSAKSDDVLILRTVDGQDYVGVYNVAAISRGNYADPEVFAGDVIMVGDNPLRRTILDVLQLTPILSTFVIAIDRIGV